MADTPRQSARVSVRERGSMPGGAPAAHLTNGVDLVGPGGLLSDLTKAVLETALEVEMREHLDHDKHAVEGLYT